MRKILASAMAASLVLGSLSVSAMAEENPVKESASGFYYIEATDTQARLSAASADKFIQADGLWFKDLNNNGALDTYEDWRLSDDERTADLVSQMNLTEKVGALGFGGIAGNNGSTVTDFNADVSGSTGDTSSIITPAHPSMTASADEVSVMVNEKAYPSMANQAQVMGLSTYIAALTGTPKDQLDLLNAMQKLAEGTRLGIPDVFSGDRTYNTWGGMIDSPHYAFGIAGDADLLYNLMSEYAKEGAAIGYHQVFHGYGNEIGSWYGDDPEFIAKMSVAETKAYNDNNFQAHSKHFIARGGRNAYVNAKSPADLIDSWMVAWKAVVDAGTEYIMCNNNVGVTPGLQGYMDKATYDILRNDLGYEGVVCLDWPLSPASLMQKTGITRDGIDVSTLTLGERYTLILDAGVDMFSCGFEVAGTDISRYQGAYDMVYYPDVLKQEILDGKYSEEALDVHVARVMKNKFGLGIFENPYRDWDDALAIISNGTYSADLPIPMSNAEIDQYRRPEIVAMENELMVKSTILYKNDGVLPLSADAKVYIDTTATDIKVNDTAAIAEKATVVDSLADATVAVFHVASFNDAYQYMIEDAREAGVPVVVIYEGTNSAEPALQQFLDADALMMQTYRNTPDHGSSVGSFYRYVTASITAEMLFGEKEPAGKTLYELGYSDTAKSLSWGELQDDIGVSDEMRLYMAMLAKLNPSVDMPNNLGDVIVTTGYGIQYSKPADIELSLLTLPRAAEVVTTETDGRVRTSTVISNTAAAGYPFNAYFVAMNNGGDGLVTVDVLVDGAVAMQKLVGVTAGQFRVIPVQLTLEAGEHTITVGDMTSNITIK